MAKRRAQQRIETRERILRGAERCFARDGFERATIKQIAVESGTTVPTLYSYFDGKKALADAIGEHLLSEVERLFEVLLPRGLTFPQKLELLIAHQFRWVEERRHAFEFLQSYNQGKELEMESSAHAQYLEYFVRWFEREGAAEEAGLDIALTAQVVNALARLFFDRWIEAGKPERELVKTATTLTELVLYGVMGRASD